MSDALSEMFQAVRIESTFCGRAELTAPWGFWNAGSPDARFYVFLDGAAVILMAGGAEPVALGPGDYVVLPHGAAHSLQDSVSSRALPLNGSLAREASMERRTLRFGGGGRATSFISGHLRLDRPRAKLLLDFLPPLLRLPGTSAAAQHEVRDILASGAVEIEAAAPGSAAILNRLSELLFFHAVRAYISTNSIEEETCNRLARLPQVAAAIRLIQSDLAAQWTVRGLASHVGMSRSGFAAAFTTALSEPPMQYVVNQRMQRAADLLKSPAIGVAQVASQVGYDSDISFARAFKRRFGMAPGAYRRSMQS